MRAYQGERSGYSKQGWEYTDIDGVFFVDSTCPFFEIATPLPLFTAEDRILRNSPRPESASSVNTTVKSTAHIFRDQIPGADRLNCDSRVRPGSVQILAVRRCAIPYRSNAPYAVSL
jgi:hypothetical protein